MNVSHYTDEHLMKILSELLLRVAESSSVYNGESVQEIMNKDIKN